MVEVLGWFSSIVLLVTIVDQIRRQWAARSGEGVSTFLFVGQSVASAGFAAYSALVHNWVFTVTNSLLLLSAITGWIITAHFKRNAHQQPDPPRIAPLMEGRLTGGARERLSRA